MPKDVIGLLPQARYSVLLVSTNLLMMMMMIRKGQ